MKTKKTRQLAAIMFTDIVGYSSLMQKDEAEAEKVRFRHRKVFKEQHKLFSGEIIQYYGDGVLSIFKSAIDSVKCAIEIQKQLRIGNPVVPIRIGLHLGDIVYNETEVYGDGVNYASRIESMGVNGAILLSSKINDELKNHTDISTKYLGKFELKNITKPAEIYCILNEKMIVPDASYLKNAQNVNTNTIAVLPFVNMSTSKENEYFCDGMTEEIINALAKIRDLKVTSRTSSFFFKNKNINISEIGEKLNVSIILEGSIRLSANKMRITAQLIDVKDDFHFWSETWDRGLEDVFEIQDEISLLIADRLREQFGHLEIQDHLVEKQTDNIDAYEYSLKANFHINKWNPEDIKIAISFYEKALQLDPNHSESYLGLAGCYSFLGTTGFMPFDEAWKKTIESTNQAAKLNDKLSGVHYQLGNIAFFVECNYNKSLLEIKKAVKINPNNAEAQQFIAFLYIIQGDREKSRKHLNIAESINPLSEETKFFTAYYHYMIEDYKKSLELLNECLKVNNKNIPAHSIKINCLLKLGKYDEVISYYDNIPSDVVILGEKTGAIGLAYALKNDSENILKYLELLKEQANGPNGFTADSYLFLMYAVSGKNEEAFNWIEQAVKNKSSLLLIRFADPLVDTLIKDKRYFEFHKELFKTQNINETTGKKKQLLSKKTISEYTKNLLEHIRNNKPYLNEKLSIRTLAEQLNIHPNKLSWLINESLGKNFNEFINHYRIEHFKSLAVDPKNSHITLMGMAYESGFKSKTVFNAFFKKETGLTPKRFLQQANKEIPE